MNERSTFDEVRDLGSELVTDLLILSDGTILAHNLTPAMAAILSRMSLREEIIRQPSAQGQSELQAL